MRTIAGLSALCVVVALSVGCYSTPVMPPIGMIYSDYSAPLQAELEGQAVAEKKGEASSQSILGLIAWGDCSLQTAAKNGNLDAISYTDYSFLNVVLGIYQKFTVTAYGK